MIVVSLSSLLKGIYSARSETVLVNIAAILSGKAPASKTIVVAIIILFERIGQYDGAVSPILCAWRRSAVDSGRLGRWWWTMANKNKSLASESDGGVFVGTNLRWVTLGGVFHLVPD